MIVIITNHSTEIVAVSQSDLNNSFSVRLQLTGKGSKTFVYFNSKVTKACHKVPNGTNYNIVIKICFGIKEMNLKLLENAKTKLYKEGGGSGSILGPKYPIILHKIFHTSPIWDFPN